MAAVALPALEGRLRALLPPLTVLAAIALDALPLPAPSPTTASPLLTLAVVVFWSLRRPDLMTPLRVFVLGLIADAVLALPPGFTALTLLTAAAASVAARRYVLRQPFPTVWLAFALLILAVEGLRWLVAGALHGGLIAFPPLLLEAGLTVAAWPLVWALLRPVTAVLPVAASDASGG